MCLSLFMLCPGDMAGRPKNNRVRRMADKTSRRPKSKKKKIKPKGKKAGFQPRRVTLTGIKYKAWLQLDSK